MSEFETATTGRREFLQTVVAAPVLAAALVDTAEAQPAQRNVAPMAGGSPYRWSTAQRAMCERFQPLAVR